MTALRLRPARSMEEWERIADRFPERTRFHSWRFLHEEADVGGWRLLPLVIESGGTAIGVVPLTIERGPLRRTPTVQHPYHGPLVPAADLPDLLRALRRERRRRAMVRLTISFPPTADGDRAAVMRRAGWSVVADTTYVLDLRPSIDAARAGETVMPFLGARRRSRLRRAQRLGVTVQRVEVIDDLLVRSMEQAFRAHDGQLRVPRGFVDWVNRVIARGDALAVEAAFDGERVGVLIGLLGGRTMLGWLGAALPEGRPVDAGTLMYHELLRLAAGQGVERSDMLGHVDEGVAHFKLSLGAQPEQFVSGDDLAFGLVVARSVRDRLRRRSTEVATSPPV